VLTDSGVSRCSLVTRWTTAASPSSRPTTLQPPPDPESAVAAQVAIGADIQMVLDVCHRCLRHRPSCAKQLNALLRGSPSAGRARQAARVDGAPPQAYSASCRRVDSDLRGRALSASSSSGSPVSASADCRWREPREMLDALGAALAYCRRRSRYSWCGDLSAHGGDRARRRHVRLRPAHEAGPPRHALTSAGRLSLRRAGVALDDEPVDATCPARPAGATLVLICVISSRCASPAPPGF